MNNSKCAVSRFEFTLTRRRTRSRPVWVAGLVVLSCTGTARAQDQTASDEALAGMRPGISATARGGVDLHVEDMPLSSVLRLLSLEGQRNIIASPNVRGSVTANLYQVSFEEALTAILTTNGSGYRVIGNFIYVYTNEELAEMDADAHPPITRVFTLNYVSAADAQSYISPLLGEEGRVSVSPAPQTGLASSASDGGGASYAARDFIIVTASEENLREVERILGEVDIRPQQVLIEATILRAELSDDNALGIDFTLLGGVDLALLGASSNGIGDIGLGQLPENRFERFNASATSDFVGDVPQGGLRIGIIKDQVAVFIRALEQVTDITVLANPKVLGLNKQKAQVIVGRRDGFLTTTVTATQAIQSVEFLETGTQLIFRPFIADDGYIRVELHPEDSVGFVNAQGLPSEQTTEITTNVLMRDGETILIGGLFREVDKTTRKQIPVLGNIPVLGALFRSDNDSAKREEVIILLTIHIVKDHAVYAEASRAVLENVEKIRVGMRQGLMWHGRDRLAQSHYRRALEALTQDRRDMALWHTNLALHNNHRLLPAIDLKERILGERAWEADDSGGREFVHFLIGKERGYANPLLTDPAPSLPPSEKPVSVGGNQ